MQYFPLNGDAQHVGVNEKSSSSYSECRDGFLFNTGVTGVEAA